MLTKVSTVESVNDNNEISVADQISLISRTANALAHELKTPLTSIKLNVEMLEEDSILSENKKKSLAILKKEINRLSAIVDSYLNLTRQNDLEFSKISLFDLIEEIKVLITPELNKRKIKFNNISSQYFFMADHNKLKSAFTDLISNAMEAIESDGTIEISTLLDESRGVFSVYICDSGCGIKDPDKLFRPFYTTKNTGNGLGLVLSSEIIKKHNGSLKLYSSVPGETVFEISFSL